MALSPVSEVTVEVNGHRITLRKLGATAQVAVASAQQRVGGEPVAVLALGAAVLALSWPEGAAWPTRSRPRPWRLTDPLLDYGGRIFDDLGDALGLDEAARISQEGFWWGLGARVTEDEVVAAEGFLEAPVAGTDG
jgi:hypothetical protein